LSEVHKDFWEVQYMMLTCKKCCRSLPNKITGCLASKALPSLETEHPLGVKWDSMTGRAQF